jgi:hypothetical protein
VAVYFELHGKPKAIPCDTYRDLASNLAAIAACIEDMRRSLRHGVVTVEQLFAGFTAIRGPGVKPWRETLGIHPDAPVDRQVVRARVAELAKRHHPDVPGGSHERMAEINEAADRAIAEIEAADRGMAA